MLDPKFTVSIVEDNQSQNYTKLALEPLKQGYGHTLGNALRRVLLTSLQGAAVTSIKVKGVRHQFTTLEGMSEDIVELVLNVKSLNVQLESGNSASLKLEAKGPGEVKASQIQTPVGVTITNPDLVLANLATKDSQLSMELTVETGTGYSPAEERLTSTIGVIPVDALFSPVRRVNPTVQSTRVGRRTDYDKLVLEIWTNGTKSAQTALEESAGILVEHFQQIFEPVQTPQTEDDVAQDRYPSETLSLTVEELDLPTRIANALRKGGYKTVADLSKATKDEVSKVKNLGDRSVSLVEDALSQKEVSFKSE